MSRTVSNPNGEMVRSPSVADQVFSRLYWQVITLDLTPGSRLSEADVARRLGISRQPVRDAFWRLSQLGFLTIRPQRATTVSPISKRSVLQAQFIRTALEIETVRLAIERGTDDDLARLRHNLAQQEAAMQARDRDRFHALDDEFHFILCEIADHGFAWTLIREHKAHMDRVRVLSLSFSAEQAFSDHRAILAAMEAADTAGAVAAMREHLGRINEILARVRREHAEYFLSDEADARREPRHRTSTGP